VRIMGFKILKALVHLRKNEIIHADLKPDNILVSADLASVKVADLGCAFSGRDEVQPNPNLVPRFYRAPEIILGLKYSYPLDMFAFGCTLFEFATGRPLLESETVNHHVLLILELAGAFPKKMLQAGQFTKDQFDETHKYFLEHKTDPVTGKLLFIRHLVGPPTRHLAAEIEASYEVVTPRETILIKHLADLIEKCIAVDPAKRVTPAEALRHPVWQEPSKDEIKKAELVAQR